jgi:putative acetyltransferase
MPIDLRRDDLSDPRIAAFLEEHLQDMRAVSPPESKHALDLDGLRQPDIAFFTAWVGSGLVGCGALKRLDAAQAELKSMRTAPAQRRSGVATVVLQHLMAEARRAGYRQLSLETGSMPFFAPARALYARHGFVPGEPFASYRPDPNSVFMHCALERLAVRP